MKALVLCEFSGRVRDSRAVDLLNLLPDIPRKTAVGERRRIVAGVLALHHPEHMFGKALEAVQTLSRTRRAQECAEAELAKRKASLLGANKIDCRVRAAGLGSLWGLSKLSDRHPRIVNTSLIDTLGSLCYLRRAGADHHLPETLDRRLAHHWGRANRLMAAYDARLAAVEAHCASLGMPPGMYLEVRDNLGDPAQVARVWAALAAKGITPPRARQPRDKTALPVAAGKRAPTPVTIDSILGELEARMPEARSVFTKRTLGQDLASFTEQEQHIAAGAPRTAAIAAQRLRRWVTAVVGLGEFSKVDRPLIGGDLVDTVAEFEHKAARKAAADAIRPPARPFSIFNLEP